MAKTPRPLADRGGGRKKKVGKSTASSVNLGGGKKAPRDAQL